MMLWGGRLRKSDKMDEIVVRWIIILLFRKFITDHTEDNQYDRNKSSLQE